MTEYLQRMRSGLGWELITVAMCLFALLVFPVIGVLKIKTTREALIANQEFFDASRLREARDGEQPTLVIREKTGVKSLVRDGEVDPDRLRRAVQRTGELRSRLEWIRRWDFFATCALFLSGISRIIAVYRLTTPLPETNQRLENYGKARWGAWIMLAGIVCIFAPDLGAEKTWLSLGRGLALVGTSFAFQGVWPAFVVLCQLLGRDDLEARVNGSFRHALSIPFYAVMGWTVATFALPAVVAPWSGIAFLATQLVTLFGIAVYGYMLWILRRAALTPRTILWDLSDPDEEFETTDD